MLDSSKELINTFLNVDFISCREKKFIETAIKLKKKIKKVFYHCFGKIQKFYQHEISYKPRLTSLTVIS